MIKDLIYLLISAILFLGSCKESQNNSTKIDPDRKDLVYLNKLFKHIEIIPLEKTRETLIHHVDKIEYSNHKFYILDVKGKSLLFFKEDCSFIYKIHSVGRGTQEYQAINDFNINQFTNKIELLSPLGQIISYNPDGSFDKSFQIPSIRSVQYFKPITRDIWALNMNYEEERVAFYSKKSNKIIKRTHRVPAYISRNTFYESPTSNFIACGPKVGYYEGFSNQVYWVTDNELKPRYTWDFGKYNFNIKDFPQLEQKKSMNYFYDLTKKLANNFYYNLENDRFIYTSYAFKDKWNVLIYDKDKKTYLNFNKFEDGPSLFWPRAITNNWLVSVIEPRHLKQCVSVESLNKENRMKLEAIKIDDNPVILKYIY